MDSLRAGISGASVLIYMAKDSISTETDKSGKFSFLAVSLENWKLIVRNLGYESNTQHIELKGDQRSIHSSYYVKSKDATLGRSSDEIGSPDRS